jgi:hypothetical protein
MTPLMSTHNDSITTTASTAVPGLTTHSQTNKDNMSIGSAESLAPRWVSPEQQGIIGNSAAVTGPGGSSSTANSHQLSTRQQQPPHSNIHWVGILRDDTMLAEYCNEPDNPKILQMSRRFLKNKTPKVDWEFKTYAVQSQRRMVHAVKFCIYDKVPLLPGARAKLVNLKAQTFLNGENVRVIEYQQSTDKYLIRPSIPLPEAQKLATTGMLVVHAKHLIAQEQEVRVWTVAVLYDGKQLSQNIACQFMEKILLISETFRKTDEWLLGTEMSCQATFAPILRSQMDQFMIPAAASIDESLEYSKELIERNMDIVSSQSQSLHSV